MTKKNDESVEPRLFGTLSIRHICNFLTGSESMKNYSFAFWSLILSCSFIALQAQESSLYTLEENIESYPILTPALKNRKTAKITLQNGIKAYLISDPDTEQSAAAVSVQAGSWHDPDSYPGTAHFLEHMLFMGSKAYPGEGEYRQYITDHGGMSNAFTAPDRTVYVFSVNNHAYPGAIDRFSHFFIDPLFNPSSMSRELLAVDQEHAKNVENDFWRQYMVLKETSSPGHPHTKFSTGNAKTLSDIPKAILQEWYESHYSPDRLHLIMLSPLSLDSMIELAVEKFSPISREKKESVSLHDQILSTLQKGHFLYVKPIKDLKMLSLVWEVPKKFASIEQKWTAELISYVLNDASSQSLLEKLKKEKMAESLSANLGRVGKDHSLFRIDIGLTEQGLSQIDTVILHCYQTISRLKQSGIPLSLFQEMQTVSQLNYQYQERNDIFSWITDAAYNIIDEPLSTFPEKTEVPSEFDPESIMQFIHQLTPEEAAYFVMADPAAIGVTVDRKEKWMDVSYSCVPVDSAKIAFWKQTPAHPKIELPPPNPFIPTALELVTKKASIDAPLHLMNKDKISIYFAPDHKYLTPKASLLFTLKTKKLDGSAEASVLSALLCKALMNNLSETLFFANNAGLFTSISPQNFNFCLKVSGYSEKALKLVEELFVKIKSCSCSQEDFAIYKASLLSSYANASLELPVKQALDSLFSVLLTASPSSQEKLDALQALSFERFSSFCQEWLDTLFLEGVLCGNVTQEEAERFCMQIEKDLSSFAPYENPKKQAALILPEDKGPFKIKHTTQRQGSGIVLTIEQGSFTFEKKAAQQLLSTALEEAFFDALRTKQQTAYIAQSWSSEVGGQLLQTFAVQSSSHQPEDLLLRFELFLEDFQKRLLEIIPEKRFEEMKAAQISLLQMPPDNLSDMAAEIQKGAFERDKPDFCWKEKLIQAVQNLSYEELICYARNTISAKNSKRLAVLVEGKQTNKPLMYEAILKEEVQKLCN
jgi:insulysin